jgi:hypothetical protein
MHKLLLGSTYLFALFTAHAYAVDCQPNGTFDAADPAASGYSIVFSDDFTNPQTIDLNAAGNAGFNWYLTHFFNSSSETADHLSISPDGLVLTPTTYTANYNIATAAPANNAQGYVGHVFGGGGYFEARIKFDPTKVNFSQGFPSFWGQSIEHAANKGASHPEGTPAGFEHFAEDDFWEYDISWATQVAYGTAIHDWYGIYTSTCEYGYRTGQKGFCDITNAGAGTPYNNFVSTKPDNSTIDWTQWHTIGHLWVPGSAANSYQGYVQNFIDGIAAHAGAGTFAPLSKIGWSGVSYTFSTLENSPAAFSILDDDHLMVILGSGIGQALNVSYVKVWQIPSCAR